MNIKKIPLHPLQFIKSCVQNKHIYWTYHVNMRLKGRSIPRNWILQSVESYAIIESYPEDKYLPSYLVWSVANGTIIHILFAADLQNNNVRIITAYKPSPNEWEKHMKQRIIL